jgi:peptidoglycan DL-endopeptidase CwlO
MRRGRSSRQCAGCSKSRNISPGISGTILLFVLAILVVTSQQGQARAATRSGASAERGDTVPAGAHAGHGNTAGLRAAAAHQARTAHQAHAAHQKAARARARAAHRKTARARTSGNRGEIAVDWALHQLGKPYRWAAAGPGSFDCSGLTMRAWGQAGVQIEHFTGYQWNSGPHIPLNQLRPGDLMFFGGKAAKPATIQHVGLYIGDGNMVDAPHDGASVRVETINEPGLIGATRPTG